MPAKVLIVEDHPLVRLGLSYSLAQHPKLELCGEADNEADALRLAQQTNPDAVIVDLTLRSGNGLDLIKRLRSRRPRLAVVVSSMYDRSVYEHRALQAGAAAYVRKDSGVETLLKAVEVAVATKQESSATKPSPEPDTTTEALTDRELGIFRLIGEGRSTRQIAEELHRSVKTVEGFRAKIKRKLGLSTSEELVRDAVRWVVEQDAA